MPVTDLLERNHKLYGDEIALVELNPTMADKRKRLKRFLWSATVHLPPLSKNQKK